MLTNLFNFLRPFRGFFLGVGHRRSRILEQPEALAVAAHEYDITIRRERGIRELKEHNKMQTVIHVRNNNKKYFEMTSRISAYHIYQRPGLHSVVA